MLVTACVKNQAALETLPDVAWRQHVMPHLSRRDLLALRSVSHRLREAVDDHLALRRAWSPLWDEPWRLWRAKYLYNAPVSQPSAWASTARTHALEWATGATYRFSYMPGLHISSTIEVACGMGLLPLLQRVHESFPLLDQGGVSLRRLLQLCCRHGHLHILEYLYTENETAVRTTAQSREWEGPSPFQVSCSEGHIEIVQYLHEALNVPIHLARADSNLALGSSCSQGHLAVLVYLHDTVGLNVDDARTNDNYALRKACINGHLPIVQYLHQELGLDKNDAQLCTKHGATWRARSNGHTDVLQYLRDGFGLNI